MELNSKLSEKLVDWGSHTTNHAIPHIIKSKQLCIKLLWTFMFIGSCLYCSTVIVRSLIDYFRYETTVSFHVVNQIPTQFPEVTVCNINLFNEDRNIHQMELVSLVYENNKCIHDNNYQETNNCTEPSQASLVYRDEFLRFLKRVVANQMYDEKEFVGLGNDLQRDMFISCNFNRKECFPGNFTKFWNNEFGYCYTFNSGKQEPVLYTSEIGPDSGLQLELVLESPKMKRIFGSRTGLRLIVHNQSMNSYTLSEGVNIPTGYEVYFGVRRVFHTKLSDPYSNCLSKLESSNRYANYLFAFFHALNVTHYDQMLCYDMCYQDKLINQCNCCDIAMPSIRNRSYCIELDQIACLNRYDEHRATADNNKICEYACPPECETIVYEHDLSMARYPTLSYLKQLASDPDLKNKFPSNDSELEEFAERSLVKLIVSYKTPDYTGIEESPKMKFEVLLGSVGGILGLFMGVSFLSFIEIIELLTDIVSIIRQHRKTNVKKATQLDTN